MAYFVETLEAKAASFLSLVDGVWKSSTNNFLAGLDPILD
jgi:hypothetical protein